MPRDLKTQALVVRRVNYGESDRILNLITPEGKISVLARGVRKEKSKLAGGIEMFTLSEVMVHFHKRDDMGLLTGAKMKEFYGGLLSDLNKLEAGSDILKKTELSAEQTGEGEHFEIARQALSGLNRGMDRGVVQAWFYLNLARANGEQVNLYMDVNGEELDERKYYAWDRIDKAMRPDGDGLVDARMIKLMRLMLSSKLSLISKVKEADELAGEILYIGRALNES